MLLQSLLLFIHLLKKLIYETHIKAHKPGQIQRHRETEIITPRHCDS